MSSLKCAKKIAHARAFTAAREKIVVFFYLYTMASRHCNHTQHTIIPLLYSTRRKNKSKTVIKYNWTTQRLDSAIKGQIQA